MVDFKKFIIAIYTDFIVAFSAIGVSLELVKWLYEGLNYRDLLGQGITENNFRLSAGSWLENEITFSVLMKHDNKSKSYGAIAYSHQSGANN
jgi:hypothetical protein